MVRADRVQPPLKHVPVDHDRTRQVTVAGTLLDRADVDDHRPGGDLSGQVGGLDPVQPDPGPRQEPVDRDPVGHRHHLALPTAIATGVYAGKASPGSVRLGTPVKTTQATTTRALVRATWVVGPEGESFRRK